MNINGPFWNSNSQNNDNEKQLDLITTIYK